MSNKKDWRLAEIGASGYNKPVKTPNHPTKSHAVVAKKGDKVKLIRFGQQGVKGAGKNPKSDKDKARRKSYYARHNAQDSSPDIFSARYWSSKVKWTLGPIGVMFFLFAGDSVNAKLQFETGSSMPTLQAEEDGSR
jgi:hypothetical protein